MFRTRIAAAATLLALAIPAAAIAADPVETRMQLMKQVGGAMKTLGGMAKGAAPFDAAAAAGAFQSMNDAADAFGAHFPEGSLTEKSEASPKVWSDAAGFEAAVAKFIADTEAAVAAAPADKAAFMPVFGQVASNCKGCHQGYRVKK